MLAETTDDIRVQGALRRHLDQGTAQQLNARALDEPAFDDRFVLDAWKRSKAIGDNVLLRKHFVTVTRRIPCGGPCCGLARQSFILVRSKRLTTTSASGCRRRPHVYNRARVMPPRRPNRTPSVVVLGGPNGAGKSTAAMRLLRGALHVDEFVNADTLARGLSAFRPEGAAIEAGRVMLRRFEALVGARTSFACESTLASVTLQAHLLNWRRAGYRIHVVYLWLPSVDLALLRVKLRVDAGGHDVPAATVRRRFERGRINFFRRYAPIADRWRLYDASRLSGPVLLATGRGADRRRILNRRLWELATRGAL
jgi:predicted ABC-type ATPase